MLHASRNPYDNAELFVALERLRRTDDLDDKSSNELGELLMSVTKYALTCMLRNGTYLGDAPDELESETLLYVIETSRKADTLDPKRYVNCLLKSAQNRVRWIMRDTRNHRRILSPCVDGDAKEVECEIDGTCEVDLFEQVKLNSKNKEPEDGQKDI
jgi:hypothetical protein